jgi:mono/diheme cytochrome c family protein
MQWPVTNGRLKVRGHFTEARGCCSGIQSFPSHGTEAAMHVIRPWQIAAHIAAFATLLAGCNRSANEPVAQTPAPAEPTPAAAPAPSADLVADGQKIFRFDTFGDEQLWTDQLDMHTAVQGVDPTTALKVGLKVDADALPPGTLENADLKDPATTVALLKLNAVVGVQATVDESNKITRLGITCALCHSSVDDSVQKGIGHRMDGWPNRDLDVGAIIALSPKLPADKKKVYSSWGPGKYDPRYNQDGKSTPLVLPPAYGLAKVKNETCTAEGPISYWNAYVAVTQMGGQGNFDDDALGIHIAFDPDLVTPKLPALRAYQHSLPAPAAPAGSFDAALADSGKAVFAQHCTSCHVGVTGTDNDTGVLHPAADTGMDGAYATRTKNKAYRTTPLRGLWQHPPYFHDGSAATLDDVVAHYDGVRKLGLTAEQRKQLVEYLKTL